mmetsp:Transcript_36645/g.89769  ORF Transcript_36645/g.89769 Transcript_36645/m.89769 type:complete len:182 (+) Transcript_36645:3-548(+)
MLAFEFVASTLLFGEVNVPMGHVWRRLRCDDRAMWSTGPLTFDIISHARRIGQITLTFESTVGPSELAAPKFLGCGFAPPDVEAGDTDRTALGCPVLPWSKGGRFVEGSDDEEDSSTESYSEQGRREPGLFLPPPKEVMPQRVLHSASTSPPASRADQVMPPTIRSALLCRKMSSDHPTTL